MLYVPDEQETQENRRGEMPVGPATANDLDSSIRLWNIIMLGRWSQWNKLRSQHMKKVNSYIIRKKITFSSNCPFSFWNVDLSILLAQWMLLLNKDKIWGPLTDINLVLLISHLISSAKNLNKVTSILVISCMNKASFCTCQLKAVIKSKL